MDEIQLRSTDVSKAERSLKIGDTVTLISGGCMMTVIFQYGDAFTCAWSFEGDVRTEILPRAALLRRGSQ